MSFTLFHVGRVPVRFHWSILLGLAVFSGFRIDPVGWFGVLGLILVHELGHALVVRWAGAEAEAIEFTGFGGLCHWRGEVSAVGRAAIAWGGVWGQLVVLAVALAIQALPEPPLSPTALRLLDIATSSNAWMIALNLLPLRPLDGREAWALPGLLGRAARRRLSFYRDVPHQPLDGPEPDLAPGSPHADAARELASQLLTDARRSEDTP
ncbi:MAG: hypothetical protein AB1938_16415 [Myxococcota bacterium]